ncbi:GNAT family N-acetyltransferase [Roseibium marinum]|uniref:Ribosomal protein S18 acetylase RimI-like enzyme n=1 Tax=Roseibium marinum TaxID=281252 RepID=A0A2S3UUV3_9HYPH|nr:GNAT family N-acetyltransferase [Roseibium marinum]POF31502.1 ribosomal protein S18 acetylase RimI-like enzyme [Roseibium marinum]
MADTVIRALRREDRPAWQVLWNAYLEFYRQDLPADVTETLFERLLSTAGHDAFVAVREGSLVGFVHYLFHSSTWSKRSTCYLEDLFVSETGRGTGAGRKLIEAVYAAADGEPGADGTVYWHTHHHNERARKLYDRVGVLSDFIRYERS